MLPDPKTHVIVQGITGDRGTYHTGLMLDAGTKVVAGVAPGRGGMVVNGVPVYESVSDALDEHEADASVVLVPAPQAPAAVYEAVEDELKLVVVATAGVPLRDTLRFLRLAREKGTSVLGPASVGFSRPGSCVLGLWPCSGLASGPVALVSRFGPLAMEAASALSSSGLGLSACLSLGYGRVVGVDEGEALEALAGDKATRSVLLVVDPERSVDPACEALPGLGRPAVAYVPGAASAREARSKAVSKLERAGALVAGSLAQAAGYLKRRG